MRESLFIEYLNRLFPKLQSLIDLVNGSRNGDNQRTYLHKTMLRKVYSADQKWSSASVNTTYVAADVVAMDSPLPIKTRPAIAHASGVLPKVGMKKRMFESDINAINIMKAQGTEWTQIANKLTADAVACSVGIDEQNEANFLTALAEGVVLVKDENNTGTGLRVEFNYLPEHGFKVANNDELTLEDIETVLDAADADGNTITTIAISQKAYNKLRATDGAKVLVANYRAMPLVITENGEVDATKLPVPPATVFDEAFADAYGGVKFLKINRSIIAEKDGKPKAYKPFDDANRVIYLTQDEVGALVWGTLAEKTNPVEGVVYSTVDEYKLIKRFRTTDPLTETTAGEALVLPVIENIDQIYYQDLKVESTDTQSTGASVNAASAKAKTVKKETV